MKRWVRTSIKVRREVLEAMKHLAELKREQRGGFGRAAVSPMLADLTIAELARVEGEAKRKERGRD